MNKMRIVIFGGTFDPWTSAHQEITERLSLSYDKVLIIPTTIRYYKINKQMFSFNERFRVACEKTKHLANVQALDIERAVNEDWRFIDTLQEVIKLNGSENEYFVAIGSDSLQSFKTWHRWGDILKLSKLVVFRRPGYEKEFPDIPYEYLNMSNPISSTLLRNKLQNYMSDEEFEDMLDEDWYLKGKHYIEEDNKVKVLVVIDMQNDFIDGALGTKEAVAIVPNVKGRIS